MELEFKNAKTQKLFNTASKLRAEYGARMAGLIQTRLYDLYSAENLEVMRLLPGRCHELSQNLAGKLAVDLVHPYRLLFEPANVPRPTRKDGVLDWAQVTKIVILEVIDYH